MFYEKCGLSFTQLQAKYAIGYQDSLAFIKDFIAVFDLRPANFVKMESGIIVPIDSIPCRLTASSSKIFSP